MPLEIANTTLKAAPYFDDFNEDKNYYRVLFRPAVAVQARELTQLQTTLQNQIERFGNHIFKDGSVVQGCSIEYIPDLEYIGVEDQFSDDSDLSVDDPMLLGAVVVGQTSDVQALVISARSGFTRQDPGRLYVRYTKPGANNVRSFLPGEELRLYGETTTYVEDIILQVANAQPFANATSLTIDAVESGNTANVLARAILANVDVANNTLLVNNVRRRFSANDTLVVSSDTTKSTLILSVGYDLSNEIGRINTLTSNTDGIAIDDSDLAGFSYGAHVSDGIVYHKGFFINVAAHNVIVNEDNNNPAGYLLGFDTIESVVTETSDESLYDNALGYSNFNAPGAHRLKLTSIVVARAANTLSNTDVFFPIVEFSNTGAVFERTDPQYAALGDSIAQRTFEESGHYIVKPFGVSSNTDPADTQNVIYDLSPGLAYVKGYRQELLTNLPVKGRRGTNTVSYSEQIVSMSFGNYATVNQVRGYFPTDNSGSVELYGSVQNGVSTAKGPTSAPSGSLIGTANIRELIQTAGNTGDPASEEYRLYLFNVKMSNSSLSFARDVKSVVYNANSTTRAFADILTANVGLEESSYTPMLFSLGAAAVKSLVDETGTSDSNFYYNAANTSASLDSSGSVNFRVPSGGGILGFTDGSDFSEDKIDLVLLADAVSANLTTTAAMVSNGSGNFVNFTGASTKLQPGEGVRHGANTYLVIAANGADSVKVANTVAASSSQTVHRLQYAGSHINLGTADRTLTINANNEATINLGSTYDNAPIDARVRFYTLQNQGAEVKKEVKRSTNVLLNIANTGTDTGPWNLGVPDVFKITGVFLAQNSGANVTADLAANYVDQFVLNDGQRDAFYDHASISIASGRDPSEFAGKKILVTFDHFVANNTTGKGFFSVDSYPVDDTVGANTSNTIRTAEIPEYFSSAQQKIYDLRDTLDFRPYKAATANVVTNLRTASVDPAATDSFDAKTTTFKPFPGQNFGCNFTHYLGRKDVLTITPAGDFIVVEGVSALNPRTPQYSADSLSIANIDVPPYPSLTDNEQKVYARPDYSVKVSVQNHKRYTMNDLSAIEQRVQRLEYYTSLNALEKATTDLKITSTDGLDRFKNGIFVDPLNNHSFGRVDVPQYKIAIDENNGYGRPFFQPEFFELEYDDSASYNTIKSGDMVTMAFAEEAFLTQQYSTDSRKLSGAPPSYNGTLVLTPNRWTEVEVLSQAVSVNATDQASTAYRMMDAPPLCSQYGWWRSNKLSTIINGIVGTASNNSLDTLRDKTSLGGENNYTIKDNLSQSITIQPYIRAREIAFRAYGLKPYTKFYVYVDDIESTNLVAPGDIIDDASHDETAVQRTSMWGTPIESNSRGEVSGKLTVPGFRFKIGRHTVKLISHELNQVTNEQVSSAAALFEADVVYNKPPPPIVVVITPPPPPPVVIAPVPAPPAPPVAPTPPPVVIAPVPAPPAPPVAPTAKFSVSGNAYVTSPANHVFTFTDASVKGTGTITTWLWNFGDGTTYNGKTPPAHTYIVSNSKQSFNATLKVTDSNGLTATYSDSLTLFKLAPTPPPAPPAPPAPHADLYITSYVGNSLGNTVSVVITGSVVGSGVIEGAGAVASVHLASASTEYAGAFYSWSVNVTSGSPLTYFVPSTSPTNRVDLVLVDPSPSNTPLTSATSIKVDYKYANGFIIGTKTIPFTLRTTNTVVTPPGGGCVTEDQFIFDGRRADAVEVGSEMDTIDATTFAMKKEIVSHSKSVMQPCVRITTESGIQLDCSTTAPIANEYGLEILAPALLGETIPVMDNGVIRNEKVVSVDDLGEMMVRHITVGNKFFLAGKEMGRFILHHNKGPVYSGGGGGGCVASDSYLTHDLLAFDAKIGDLVDAFSAIEGLRKLPVKARRPTEFRDSVRLVTESGATLRCSKTTPFTKKGAKTDDRKDWVLSPNMLGEEVLVDRDGVLSWEKVVRIDQIGVIEIAPLNVSDQSFAAGDVPNVRIYSHNLNYKKL